MRENRQPLGDTSNAPASAGQRQSHLRDQQLADLYTELARSATRLMVVHEAGRILSSTHDAEQLAQGLLSVIAEAVFAGSGCVARLRQDQLDILATVGLEEPEVDALATSPREASILFTVADERCVMGRDELLARFGGVRSPARGNGRRAVDRKAGAGSDGGAELEGNPSTAASAGIAGATIDDPGLAVLQEEAPPEPGEQEWNPPDEEPWAPPDEEPVPGEPEPDEPGFREARPDALLEPGALEPGLLEPGAFQPAALEGGETGAAAIDASFELYIPLEIEDRVLGVVALGRRVDGAAFGAEDRQLAGSLAAHLAVALESAALFADKERRIEQLNVLLQLSKEITSTLDLERVLATIAQMMGMVVPNRRAVVALVSGGSGGVAIRASSEQGFDARAAKADPLLPCLVWAHGARQGVNVSRAQLAADPQASGRDVLLPYLERDGGPRGLSIQALEDDQGVLGLLVIESDADQPPVDDEQDELVTILANQTTVALRNAELYQRMPMIGVLQPLFQKRAGAGSRRQLLRRLGVAAAIAALGLLVPLPAWVSGDAFLRPGTPVALRAETAGIVERVLVNEGDRVKAGTLVATLRDDEITSQLEQARASIQRVRAEGARARSAADLATYRAREAELLQLQERERYLSAELGRVRVVAPIDGVVLTPRVELRRGEQLGRGEVFAELADLSTMEVDVTVPETDIRGVAEGASARLKVHAYPGRTFRGKVLRIAPRADAAADFRVTLLVDNADGALRPGMTGRAHVRIGPRPILQSFLRPALRAVRMKLWI